MQLTVDNRTPKDVLDYQEARIEALKRRIEELEAENVMLKGLITAQQHEAA